MSINARGGVNSIFKGLLAVALLTSGVALTSPAYAINAQQEKVSVSIDARDLETDRGVERIYRTLSKKAENSCVTPGVKSVSDRMIEKACVKRLLTEFIVDVDHVKLNAYHAAYSSA